ncbi:MAG: murein biosynthesis integral membrane protein MurJ [Leucobacter sp.]
MASGLLRASAVMASGTMVSRALGFVKAILLVYAIGQTASISADAFSNGNMLPNTLYMILMGGMLNAVLVPQIVAAAKNRDGGRGYINKIVTLVTFVLLIVTAAAMLAVPWLVKLYALSWSEDQLALAAAFAYWCVPQIVFYALYTVLGEVLNARSVFGPFTWAPVMNNIVSIAGILVFISMFGPDPEGLRTTGDWTSAGIAVLAGSATLGVMSQALILFVSWRKAGIQYRPDFKWRGMGLAKTGRIAGWSLATVIILNLSGIVSSNVLATATGEGPANAAMTNAWLIFMLPHSVIAVSLATAYFTRLAESGQSGRMTEFRADLSASVRQITLIMVLASVLILVTAPFISRVMQPGATGLQVEQFAIVLRCYMLGLALYSILFLMQRAFYALSDTRTPFIFTTVQVVLLAALCIPVLMVSKDLTGAAYGVAWSISILVQAVIATWLLHRRIGSLDGKRILVSIVRYLIAAVPTIGAGLALAALAISLVPDFGIFAAVGFAVAIAGLVSLLYVVVLWLLRSPELRDLIARLSRRRAV